MSDLVNLETTGTVDFRIVMSPVKVTWPKATGTNALLVYVLVYYYMLIFQITGHEWYKKADEL